MLVLLELTPEADVVASAVGYPPVGEAPEIVSYPSRRESAPPFKPKSWLRLSQGFRTFVRPPDSW